MMYNKLVTHPSNGDRTFLKLQYAHVLVWTFNGILSIDPIQTFLMSFQSDLRLRAEAIVREQLTEDVVQFRMLIDALTSVRICVGTFTWMTLPLNSIEFQIQASEFLKLKNYFNFKACMRPLYI